MASWRERIVSNKQALGGRPTFRGTRISVEFILSLLGSGWYPDEVCKDYPALDLLDLQAAFAFSAEMLQVMVGASQHLGILPIVDKDVTVKNAWKELGSDTTHPQDW